MNIFFASLLSSLTLICATPLPQDPGDSTIMEPFITGDNVDKNLQRPNLDLTSTNTLEGIEQADITALNGDCEVQSSTAGLSDVKDENSVYKRATTSCPVNAGGNSVIVAPFGRVLQTAPERLPVPKGSDIACVKYRGKGLTKHVSCGGPIIGTVADIVKTILNCIPGSKPVIEARPRFHETDNVAEFCCRALDDDYLFTGSDCQFWKLAKLPVMPDKVYNEKLMKILSLGDDSFWNSVMAHH